MNIGRFTMINSNSINLNLLKFFIATAESESISKAGEDLGYSHSTVSTGISTLEKQLGVTLFKRKPLELTDVGYEMYKAMKQGFADIDFAMLLADSRNNMDNGKISIGCPSHIVEFYLMDILSRVSKDYPNLKISLDTSYECENLIESIKDNKVDFAILDRIPDKYENDVEIKEIKKSDYIFIANKKIIIEDVKQLENYKYILSGEQRGNTIKLLNILKEYEIKLDVRLRCRINRTESKCSKIRNWYCICIKRGSKKDFRK